MASAELYRDKLREAESPKLLADAVSRISSRLRFSSDDVFSLAQSAFPDAVISGAEAFLKITSGDFSERWKAACGGLSADEASKRLFSELGEILGTSDAQSQADRLGVIEAGLRDAFGNRDCDNDSLRCIWTLHWFFRLPVSGLSSPF